MFYYLPFEERQNVWGLVLVSGLFEFTELGKCKTLTSPTSSWAPNQHATSLPLTKTLGPLQSAAKWELLFFVTTWFIL